MYAPIFISGIHKSGTSLMRSLLDGHPQLWVIPFETHYFQNVRHWVLNPYRYQTPKKLSVDDMIESFTSWMKHYNEVDNPMADSIVTGKINISTFRKYFSNQNESISHAERIVLYFNAIYHAIHNDTPDKKIRFVEKSVENAEFSFAYQSMFPDAKFIHVIRNPYANIVSLRKFRMANNKSYPLLYKILETFKNNFYHMYQNRLFLNNHYIVRYEDMVSDPENTMRSVSDFLHIDFDPVLLTPTLLKESWMGNSTSGEKFTSITSKRIHKWNEEIYPIEVYYINRIIPFVLEDYSYDKIVKSGSFWKPLKKETIRKYLSNRFFRYYI